ncbi:unnamed protein product [Adineta steineri]|uniref:NAD(P)-binding domain-containing protein n=1 Tax=Adineta steineri TaxID=433720 RepID=A0A813SLQ1_9BILA|nr:unnamed protein product [Adineta steineri]
MSKTILVTGANSFIGGWIVKYLIEKGYNVRGTVRSQAKELQVLDGISKDKQNQISFVHIPDITTDSFEEAIKDVHGIIHVASPYHFKKLFYPNKFEYELKLVATKRQKLLIDSTAPPALSYKH